MSDGMEIVFRTRGKEGGRVMVGRFMSKESKLIGKITTAEAAEIINVSPQYVRIAMQQGKLPIGSCVKMSSIWTYNISPKMLAEYSGKDIRNMREELEGIRARKAAKKKARDV